MLYQNGKTFIVSCPIVSCMSIRRSLKWQDDQYRCIWRILELGGQTKATVGIARALALLPLPWSTRTVSVRVVFVTYVIEEVDLILACKEGDSNTVHWCITPSLHRFCQ